MFPGGSPDEDHEGYCSAENPDPCTGELDGNLLSHSCVYIRQTDSKTDGETKIALAAPRILLTWKA